MMCLPEPKVVATTIIIKKMKNPKKHIANPNKKGETQLNKKGCALKMEPR